MQRGLKCSWKVREREPIYTEQVLPETCHPSQRNCISGLGVRNVAMFKSYVVFCFVLQSGTAHTSTDQVWLVSCQPATSDAHRRGEPCPTRTNRLSLGS